MDYIRRRWNNGEHLPGGTSQPGGHGNEPEDSLDYGNQPDDLLEYIPIRFLENRIQGLSQTSVPHDLGRLQQHKENMEQMRESKEWDKLHAEQMNASRTVQQLRGHLETLDELRQQVTPADVAAFDRMTEPVRVEILAAVESYQKFTIRMDYVGNGIMENGDTGNEDRGHEDEGVAQTQGQWLMVANRNADHYQSLEDLRKDLEELNGLVKQFNTTVEEHSRGVSRLNNRAETTRLGIQGGVTNLRGGQRLKAYVLPVGGAIVGGVLGGFLGGPVGAVAGLKVGALTAATAGTAGVVGGALLGYRVNKTQDDAEVKEETSEEEQENKKDK